MLEDYIASWGIVV